MRSSIRLTHNLSDKVERARRSFPPASCRSRAGLEVIRPQVPLRPPCYDFSPLTKLGFDVANVRLRLTQASLGWSDGRCVQGAGTYSPRDDDARLLGIPCSRGRVAALDPNYGRVSGLPSPFEVGTHCPCHCSTRVARGIQGILTCRGPLLHSALSAAVPPVCPA